jgi:hypothetical protein
MHPAEIARSKPRLTRKEKTVSTAALSRNPSRLGSSLKGIGSIGNSLWSLITGFVRTGKDRRVLQMLPDRVLADMGLQKMEIRTGTDGGRHVWVIPHRYY